MPSLAKVRLGLDIGYLLGVQTNYTITHRKAHGIRSLPNITLLLDLQRRISDRILLALAEKKTYSEFSHGYILCLLMIRTRVISALWPGNFRSWDPVVRPQASTSSSLKRAGHSYDDIRGLAFNRTASLANHGFLIRLTT